MACFVLRLQCASQVRQQLRSTRQVSLMAIRFAATFVGFKASAGQPLQALCARHCGQEMAMSLYGKRRFPWQVR